MSTAPATALRRLPATAVAVGALAAAGGTAAVLALSGGAADRVAAPAPAAQAPAPQSSASPRLQTTFGAVSVDSVVRLTGSRRPMGVPVGEGELPIQVAVTVTNLRDEAYRVPRSLLMLEGARRTGIDPGNRPDFRVPALSAHRFVLRAAVADGVLLPDLVVREAAGNDALRVALGRTDDLTSLNVATHTFGETDR